MGKGTQVLLFESRNSNTPLNVHSLCINRYGCSYLAGAMSTDRDAKIWAATSEDSIIKTAIRGFMDGYNLHNKDQNTLSVKYLTNKEEGFAVPDSVYKEMKRNMMMMSFLKILYFRCLVSLVWVLFAMLTKIHSLHHGLSEWI